MVGKPIWQVMPYEYSICELLEDAHTEEAPDNKPARVLKKGWEIVTLWYEHPEIPKVQPKKVEVRLFLGWEGGDLREHFSQPYLIDSKIMVIPRHKPPPPDPDTYD
jgi:hypothetical protein